MPTSPWGAPSQHSRRPGVGRRAACLAAAVAIAGCQQQAEERQPAAESDTVANAGPAPVAEADPAAAAAEPAAAMGNDATASAPAPAARKPWSASGYTLSGTEPFWGGTVTGSRFVYQTPEDQAGTSVAASVELGAARESYAGTLAGKPFRLTLTKGSCSNGMSDRVFAFTANLTVAGEERRGCADSK
jgi:uncharacterized membrane protein